MHRVNICPVLTGHFPSSQEAHVNSCYKHFYYFVTEFDLVKDRELDALKEMTARICRDPDPSGQPPPVGAGAGPH